MGVKITGLDKLMKQLNDPKELAKKVIDNNNGIEIDCPNCQKKIKVPLNGTTCSCGKKIKLNL
ncbi:hypothetical protein [Brochothrix thermosphacta]|uniref:hypothetical protein n=1 Tax=Brochothrix thermosphacta TaxID=2756 RepID=UPI0003E87A8C|nr:hypothetical protein [Brochothrix thermosphacta]EUJ38166.1 hypothetical protein BTHER_02285 [Brochothrix thermosphacta DSM 20171 = FSL F6-1036]ODJ49235.1 hypothetical protein BFR34_06255 [Brochothrix thermosphacta DSM 20171 = FSL F6-1036]